MRKDDSYKGFEFWWNEWQMRLKMYFRVLVFFFIMHVAIIIVASWYFIGWAYVEVTKYIIGCFSNFQSPDPDSLKMAASFILQKSLWFLIPSLGIYLFYPAVIRMFKRLAKKQSEPRYVRGARFLEAKKIAARLPKGDLPFGSFRLPRQEEIKHCFVIGRPGTGKTVLLSQIVERLIERKEKVVLYDFKGDYLSRFYESERDVIFNPLDVRCQGWNIFREIKTVVDINTVAESLIPPVYTGEAFWNEAARGVFVGLIHYLHRHGLKNNQAVWAAVTSAGKDIHGWLNATKGGERGFRFIEDASGKQALTVFAVLMQYCCAFEYMAGRDGTFSIDEWLASDKGGIIFVSNKSEVRDTLKPILSLFVDLFSKKLLALPDNLERRVFFILDELGTLQRLPSIKDLLTASRSKGGSAWLGIQDVGQLNKIYTQDVATSIVSACGTSVMFAVSDPTTAEYLSKKIGDTEFLDTEENYTAGVSDSKKGLSWARRTKTEKLILPVEFMNLPDLHAYAKIPNVLDVTEVTLTYKPYTTRTEGFIIRPDLVLDNIQAKQEALKKELERLMQSGGTNSEEPVGNLLTNWRLEK